jgi:hypothetical protein
VLWDDAVIDLVVEVVDPGDPLVDLTVMVAPSEVSADDDEPLCLRSPGVTGVAHCPLELAAGTHELTVSVSDVDDQTATLDVTLVVGSAKQRALEERRVRTSGTLFLSAQGALGGECAGDLVLVYDPAARPPVQGQSTCPGLLASDVGVTAELGRDGETLDGTLALSLLSGTDLSVAWSGRFDGDAITGTFDATSDVDGASQRVFGSLFSE